MSDNNGELVVKEGKVVCLDFVLSDGNGVEIDRSMEGFPLPYLHGAQNIVEGLEEALEGKKIGDEVVVDVPPAKGYGFRRDGMEQTVPADAFPADMDVDVGMQFFAEGPDGQPMPIWVMEVDQVGGKVMVDANHPLAGVTLHFEVKVLAIREPTAGELEHGHPHGPDGTHHHH